ncbi:MAG: acetyl-CoA carboxylase biotin carboxyl carrier protein [Afipia sp.]
MVIPVHDWSGLTEAVEARAAANTSISYDLSYADALNILRLVDTTPNVRELRITLNDMKIEVTRDAETAPPAPAPVRPVAAAPAASPVLAPPPRVEPKTAGVEIGADVAAVRSPIAGVFYRSQSPGVPAFVEIGAVVDEDTVVGIIEVMKVMNNIKAGVKGVVKEICVANEELVQFDQTLVYISPSEQVLS